MSDRGRVVLIFAAVALIAGGAGFYFFQIYQPAQALKAAQEEIVAWEARYQEARGCLLGKTPGSTKTSEALAIREMAPDPWDRGKCTPLVSKLSRGIANDTGVEAVEAAWLELDEAAKQAALAFAKHVGSSTTLATDPLPGALDALDSARDKLRGAAKLSAITQTGTPLAPAEIVALADGKEPVTDLEVSALPSAHGYLTFGETASHQVQIVLPTGGTPAVSRVGAGSIRALPDASWGATPGMLTVRGTGKAQDSIGEVQAGAMDAEGAIASPAKLELAVPLLDSGRVFDAAVLAPGDRVGSVMLAAVVGTLADGAFVYGGNRTLVIGRAKASAITADKPITIDVATASTDLDGRAAVVWTTPDKLHKALLLGAGNETAFELPDSFQGAPCLTKDRIWVMGTNNEVFAFGGGRPLVRIPVPPFSGLQGCTSDAALVRERSGSHSVMICADQCRTVAMPRGAPASSAITEAGGKLRAIASHAGVLGVWSEDKPPVFYALPTQARPVRAGASTAMALSNGKVIDILAHDAKGYVVIRIPAG